MRTRLAVIAFFLAVPFLAPPLQAQDESSSSQTQAQQDKSESSARASEESSSKDTRIDLTPPKDDQKNHPMSGVAISDAEESASDVQEFHPWDPHKAAKNVEVGDFYFKRKNYRAALDRYKEALIYKPTAWPVCHGSSEGAGSSQSRRRTTEFCPVKVRLVLMGRNKKLFSAIFASPCEL